MKKNIGLLVLFLMITSLAYAALTPGQIPVTKTGGSNPALQDGSITDTGAPAAPGNVGIANTNPQYTLDVGGSVHSSGGYTGNLTGDVTGNLTGNVTGDVSGNVTGTLTGDVEGNLIGNATLGTATTSGNVGIGSLSPGQMLDIQGTARLLGIQDVGIGTTVVAHVCVKTSANQSLFYAC